MDWPRSLSGAIPEVSSHGPTHSPDLLKGNTPQPPERGTRGILPLSTEWLLPFGDKTPQGNYLFDKDSCSSTSALPYSSAAYSASVPPYSSPLLTPSTWL